MSAKFGIHFGVFPTNEVRPSIAGHNDPRTELSIELPIEDTFAFVTGSWKCWGTHDQDGEGDTSLHVVVYTNTYEAEHIEQLRVALVPLLGPASRLLDYAVISSMGDWSYQHHIATMLGSTVTVTPSEPVISQYNPPYIPRADGAGAVLS